MTEKWRHRAFTVILAQDGSQPLITWSKMQSFLWRKYDCSNTAFLSSMRELNMQARLLLDTRTAPGLQPFKQLFQCLDFTRSWLKACNPQKQHLNCIFPCKVTSEQGWNCSWLPQSSARATHKSQISWGRGDFSSTPCSSLCWQKKAHHCYHLALVKLFFSCLHGQGTLVRHLSPLFLWLLMYTSV